MEGYALPSVRLDRAESKCLKENDEYFSVLVAANCGLHWDEPKWKATHRLPSGLSGRWQQLAATLKRSSFRALRWPCASGST